MARRTLDERFWQKVDKSGDCWIWTGSRNNSGYGRIQQDGKVLYAHRISYEWAYGLIPAGNDIDHKCHTRACVNPAHLRAATRKQNNENRHDLNRNNTSGVMGVVWRANRWEARCQHNGRPVYVGRFVDKAEAEAAVVAKRLELFTHNDWDRAA